MQAKDFQRMFTYDSWANHECLSTIGAAGSGSADGLARMAHILSAEKLWLERIQQHPQTLPVWPASTIDDCVALAGEMASKWQDYLAQLEAKIPRASFEDTIEYRNSKGEPWSSRVEDILMHVLFHSAYHRGQIALQMRASGTTPASTDFIHAVRQGFVE
jgi:uncharacterized damage-inducible protein DinB